LAGIDAELPAPPNRRPATPEWSLRRIIFWLCLLALIVSVLGVAMIGHRADDAYVTYRYAKNVLAGKGFVFNEGEPVLGTTSPFHAFMLVALGWAFSDLPTVANTISAVSAFVLSATILLIGVSVGAPRAGGAGAVMVATCTHTFLFAPLETVFAAALSWLLILFHIRRRWLPFAATAAIALMTRADSLLLVGFLTAVDLFRSRRPGQTFRIVGLILGLTSPWLLYATIVFGSPIPNTAFAKSGWAGQTSAFLSEMWPKVFSDLLLGSPVASIVVIVMSFIGAAVVVVDRRLRVLWIVPVWMVLYVVAYTALGLSYAFSWYYYPLVCGCLVLAGYGIDWLLREIDARLPGLRGAGRRIIAATAAAAAVGLVAWQVSHTLAVARQLPTAKWSGARDTIYRNVAEWLNANARPGSSVAMCEVGAIAYYSDVRVIDLWGLVTPAVIEHVKHGDFEWAVRHFRPDFVVSHYRKKGTKPGPTRWLTSSYHDYRLVQSFETAAYPFIIDLYQRRTAGPGAGNIDVGERPRFVYSGAEQ